MSSKRSAPTSAVANGRWYIAGGGFRSDEGAIVYPADVDMYELASGTVSSAGPLSVGRTMMEAVSGFSPPVVAFTGGDALVRGFPFPISVAKSDLLLDGVWRNADMTIERYAHATAFAGEAFIVAGGQLESGEHLKATEVLRRQGGWRPVASMAVGRMFHSLTALDDGVRVLAVGGCGVGNGNYVSSAEIFDAVHDQWRETSPAAHGRCCHRAVRLRDGRVLVSGGSVGFAQISASVEIFDPVLERWTEAKEMLHARERHVMVTLDDGRVVVAGGTNDPYEGEAGALASAEIYDPATDQWTELPPLNDARWFSTGIFADGAVYLAGGLNSTGALASIERLRIDASAPAIDEPQLAQYAAGGCSTSQDPSAPEPERSVALVGIALTALYALRVRRRSWRHKQ